MTATLSDMSSPNQRDITLISACSTISMPLAQLHPALRIEDNDSDLTDRRGFGLCPSGTGAELAGPVMGQPGDTSGRTPLLPQSSRVTPSPASHLSARSLAL